jgi:WD40 repeat protein
LHCQPGEQNFRGGPLVTIHRGDGSGPPRQFEVGHVVSADISQDWSRLLVAPGARDSDVENFRTHVLRIWDIRTGTDTGSRLRGHSWNATGVAFGPDAQFVASSSSDTPIRFWSSGEAQPSEEAGVEGGCSQMSFSAAGKLFGALCGGQVSLWAREADTWAWQRNLDDTDGTRAFDLASDGGTVAVVRDDVLEIRQLPSLELIGKAKQDFSLVRVARFSPDGKLLATAGGTRFYAEDDTLERRYGEVRLWDTQKVHQVRYPLRGHEDAVTSVAFSKDARRLATGSEDQSVAVWSIGAPPSNKIGSVADPSRGPVTLSDSGSVGAICRETGSAVFYDSGFEEGGGTEVVRCNSRCADVALSQSGRLLAVACSEGVRLRNQDENVLIGTEELGMGGRLREGRLLAFSEDERWLAAIGSDGSVRAWPTASFKESVLLGKHEDAANAVSFAPNNRWVVTGGDDGVRMWDVVDRTMKYSRPTPDPTTAIVASPDGSIVVSGDEQGTLRWWNAPTGQLLGQVDDAHEGPALDVVAWLNGDRRRWARIAALSFSSDGALLFSAGWDYSVRIWDAKTRAALGVPMHLANDNILSFAFAAKGNRMAIASYSGVTLWKWGEDLKEVQDDVRTITRVRILDR